MIIDGKVYRNLEGQVEYLTEYLQSNAVAAELGIKVVGTEAEVSDIPAGEYNYGDAYMIGTEVPYTLYIWTRANGNHPEDFWFNVGRFPMPGPQGEPGIGIEDITDEAVDLYGNSNATYDFVGSVYNVNITGTKSTTLEDYTTIDSPISLQLPIKTDGQIVLDTWTDENEQQRIRLRLDKTLNGSYVALKTGYGNANQPYVYGGNYVNNAVNLNDVKALPIKFATNNLVMFPATGNDEDNNTFTGTGTACHWNTMLGKGNHMYGSNQIETGNTENLVFGGKNQIHIGVQDSSTFGYRNEVYANQAFTAGYKNYNYGSESAVIGNQNQLLGNITIDYDGPDYDGASSDSKHCAIFGYKNVLQRGAQQLGVIGGENTIGRDNKWNFIAGSHHDIGRDNRCVNALDYGNISERYVEDCTMIGYYNHIYGGTSNSWVYAVNMIGHDNVNKNNQNNTISHDVILLGNSLRATQENGVCVGKYNEGDLYNCFEVGNGTDNDNRSNAFAVGFEPLDGHYIDVGNTRLTEAQIQALKALIS